MRRLRIEISPQNFDILVLLRGNDTQAAGPRIRRSKMRVWHCLTNRRGFGFVSVAWLLAFLSATGASQEKNQPQPRPPQQEPPAVLKVTTRLVTVDVVARDRHGNPVRDLKASDFQLTEQAG